MIRQSNFETSDGQILCIFISDWWRYLIRGQYRKMIVWQKAMNLTEAVYVAIRKLPPAELYALSAQIRRSVVSIPSNIAEGAGSNTDNDLRHFMTVARGSATEHETQLMICEMLNYLNSDDVAPLLKMLDEIIRMFSALIKNGSAD